MKKLRFIVIAVIMIIAANLQGQVSVNIRIGTPPAWGLTGYQDVRYYYIPAIEVYYDIPLRMFIYFDGRNWIHRRHLPAVYRKYDLYRAYKVPVMNYRGETPYIFHNEYSRKYREYRDNYERERRGHFDEGESHGHRHGHKYDREHDDD